MLYAFGEKVRLIARSEYDTGVQLLAYVYPLMPYRNRQSSV